MLSVEIVISRLQSVLSSIAVRNTPISPAMAIEPATEKRGPRPGRFLSKWKASIIAEKMTSAISPRHAHPRAVRSRASKNAGCRQVNSGVTFWNTGIADTSPQEVQAGPAGTDQVEAEPAPAVSNT
jgi:hypothetical protein